MGRVHRQALIWVAAFYVPLYPNPNCNPNPNPNPNKALIWVAAFYVPLIYPIGVLAHVAVFFVKCISRHLPRSPAISRHLAPSPAISRYLPPSPAAHPSLLP